MGATPAVGPQIPGAVEPSSLGYGQRSAPGTSADVVATKARLPRVLPSMVGGAALQPKGRMAVASVPHGKLAGLQSAGGLLPVRLPAMVARRS